MKMLSEMPRIVTEIILSVLWVFTTEQCQLNWFGICVLPIHMGSLAGSCHHLNFWHPCRQQPKLADVENTNIFS